MEGNENERKASTPSQLGQRRQIHSLFGQCLQTHTLSLSTMSLNSSSLSSMSSSQMPLPFLSSHVAFLRCPSSISPPTLPKFLPLSSMSPKSHTLCYQTPSHPVLIWISIELSFVSLQSEVSLTFYRENKQEIVFSKKFKSNVKTMLVNLTPAYPKLNEFFLFHRTNDVKMYIG